MPEAASEVGTFFGKYFLMKKLAAGGMGEIFLARQQGPAGFQKVLVVKKILAHLTENKEFIEAFLGEARLAAQMNHRNIVQVFELGEEGGVYFIAMEYVQGKTLRDVIDSTARRKERLHPELCRQIAEMVCDGASYAHNLTDMGGRSLNLVHRDLNPQNVLLSYTGDLKIIDFGIAKSEMSTVKTEAGMIKGKFVYMSPEQSLAKRLDKRSDIFAIGISLYEMLTGINPFQKNNIVLTLEAVQRYEPPPPSEVDPSYAPFDPILAKALAKDRDRRYPDAAEMQDDLHRVVLPRPPERLGPFMARLFRPQLEEEQKLLMDSDRARVGGGPKTPPRAGLTPPKAASPQRTEPDAAPATMILSGGPRRAGSTPPGKPSAADKRPGDTLVDGEEETPGPPTVNGASDDDLPGGTALLKPGQAPMPAPGNTQQGSTAFLGTSPRQAAAKKPAPKSSPATTSILTPEETLAAQQEALAKQREAERGVVRTRTRQDKRTELKLQKSGRGLWLALGVGGLVAVAGIVGLLLLLVSEDAPAAPRRKRPVPAPVETAQLGAAPEAVAPAEEKVEAAPAQTPAPATAKRAERKAPQKKVAAVKVLGTLTLNPGPNVPVIFGRNPMPRQPGAFNLPVTAQSGTIDVGDDSTQFRVTLEYAVVKDGMTIRLNSTPWAIAAVNGPSRGRTPVNDLRVDQSMTVVELKKPGSEAAMTLRLLFKPN